MQSYLLSVNQIRGYNPSFQAPAMAAKLPVAPTDRPESNPQRNAPKSPATASGPMARHRIDSLEPSETCRNFFLKRCWLLETLAALCMKRERLFAVEETTKGQSKKSVEAKR